MYRVSVNVPNNPKPHSNTLSVETVATYAALVLGHSTFTELFFWTLCAHAHGPSSRDTHKVNDWLTMQIRKHDTNTVPTNHTSTIIKC